MRIDHTTDSALINRLHYDQGFTIVSLVISFLTVSSLRVVIDIASSAFGWERVTEYRLAFASVAVVLAWNAVIVARARCPFVNGFYLLSCVGFLTVAASGIFGLEHQLPDTLRRLVDIVSLLLLGVVFFRLVVLFLNSGEHRQQRLFENLAWGTSHRVGPDFLAGLVSTLVSTLKVQAAFVTELNVERSEERVLSVAHGDSPWSADSLSLGATVLCTEVRLAELFSESASLIFDLTDSSQKVIGHLCLLHSPERVVTAWQRSSLQVFASRVSAELLRIRADRMSEEMESRMLHVQKLESLGVLAGGIAHDFNNLLQAIGSHASILTNDRISKRESTRAVRSIELVVDKGAMLCDRLLTYAGRAIRDNDVCDVNRIVRDTVEIVEAARTDSRISITLPPDAMFIWGDAAQLGQVLMNLLTNATDATSGSTAQIQVQTRIIDETTPLPDSLTLATNQPYVLIEVADNGCGISPEDLPQIFDPFYTTKEQGRGIGLAAVASIVRDHGGEIAIHSDNGIGTTFYLVLPLTEKRFNESDHANLDTDVIPEQLRLLVVDDDELVRTSTQLLLKSIGAEVSTADSGEEALIVCADRDVPFDCIVMDQTMPGLSGLETCQRLRSMQNDVPVILTSGYSKVDLHPDLTHVRFLTKPATRQQLLQTVVDAVSDSGRLLQPQTH